MGFKANDVSDDQEFDWPSQSQSETPLQYSDAAELPKPPFKRRQPPLEQQSEPPLNCPRCGSANTKFCYYNNYNKSQPRHFCKSCKRHWTKGGTLRSVPVGGGRKNKRLRLSATAATAETGKNLAIMSNILYKDLGSSNGMNVNTEYPFSRVDVNNSVINNPTSSYQSFNDHLDNIHPSNLDSMDESTITTLDITKGSWPDLDSGMDLPNYSNWNEINVLTTPDDLSLSWEDIDADQF